jgi:hypothetical protein
MYPDRREATRAGAAELVPELEFAGLATIPDVQRMLKKTQKAFSVYERENSPDSGQFFAVGVVRTSLYLADPKARERYAGMNPELERHAID